MSTDAANTAARIAAIPVPLPGPGIGVPTMPDPSEFISWRTAQKTVFDGDDWSIMDTSVDIEGAAARVVAAYDRDNDGAIDLDAAKLLGETTRFTSDGSASIRKLAEYADQLGNKDGRATTEEVAAAIRKFDQGIEGDGRLSGQERETFLEVFGEDVNRLRPYHPQPIHMRHLPRFHRDLPVGRDLGDDIRSR